MRDKGVPRVGIAVHLLRRKYVAERREACAGSGGRLRARWCGCRGDPSGLSYFPRALYLSLSTCAPNVCLQQLALFHAADLLRTGRIL